MRNEMLKIRMQHDMNYANVRKIDYYTSSIPEILHKLQFSFQRSSSKVDERRNFQRMEKEVPTEFTNKLKKG